ncbi:hypothetical protein FACS189459_3360 [Bacilli bacterium]|nr:hypothetical protein FACS189459_3360 [Bacilli bacterium]
MPSEDLEPTDDQKVVAYDDFAIQLASGKILSKEETFKNIKGGKTDLFVKSNENKLSHIKHSSGTKYVRVMADNFEKNNLLKLPKIKYITLNKEEKTIYNEIMKLSGIKKNNIKLVNKKISKAKAINIKSKSNKTIAAKKSANNKHMRVASNKKHPPSIKKNSDKTISKQKTKNNIKPRNGYKNIKNISNKNNIKNNLK